MTMRRWASKTLGQTTRLAMPCSSSMVTNTTPEAVPGRWRTRTSPARTNSSSFFEVFSTSVGDTPRSVKRGRSSASGWERNDIENEP